MTRTTRISSCAKSAARWAILKVCPFSKPFASWGYEMGRDRCLFMHLTLVPYIAAAKELKTKPTQHSVKELRSIGIQPDMLLCRADREIPLSDRRKIALFCNIQEQNVIEARDVSSIYEVPSRYHEQGMDTQILKHFGLPHEPKPDLSVWADLVDRSVNASDEVNIAIVGKYTGIGDVYKSLGEALDHAGMAHRVRVNQHWIDAVGFEKTDVAEMLGKADAILVPGGFGDRGIAGKLAAIRYARENNIPYFGICLGMQLAVIEMARNLAGLEKAYSTEFTDFEESDERGPLVGLDDRMGARRDQGASRQGWRFGRHHAPGRV